MKMRNPEVSRVSRNRHVSPSIQSIPAKPLPKKNTRIIWRAFKYYFQLKRLQSYVSEHSSETLSLKQAAGIASMEESYFSEFFHRSVGVPFKWWMDFIRIQRAAKRIEDSDSSITEVALNSGFTDSTTFTRTFRRVVGVTPREYRRRVRTDITR
jgi:AraC-like DNA-binding protein